MNTAVATILIVDDEIANRRLLEMLLRHEGYRTESAASGDEALALIERRAPDLILLDVMMPDLDGYQVARILKAHPQSLNIPIIMVSAQSDRTARLAGLNAGAEEFLTKPIDRDELWLRVRNLLRLKGDADLVRSNSALLEHRVQARTADLQRFRAALDVTADALALVDRATLRYVEVNAAGCELSGYTRDELLSMQPSQLSHQTLADVAHDFDAIIAGDGPTGPQENILRHKDGSEVCVEVNRHALQTSEGWTIVSVARDITERKHNEATLKQLAHYDALTGLPNRRLFQEALSKAIEQADALDLQAVLMYLDLDDFKDINDSLGHAVGDELLRGIGQRLLGTLYPRDNVGRLGGDEFGIILLTPRNPELAMRVAQRIHDALRAPFQLSGHSVTTASSIGIAVYPTDTTDVDVLARYADMAMYEAKASGRNTTRFFTPTLNQRVREKLQLVTDLRRAHENGEFVLHYQPKVSLRTGHWTGVEALLRWERPGHGLVPPHKFIPALEESGLIVPVGAWVVSEACSQLADWRRRGLGPLPIAVNVSALQIASKPVPANRLQAPGDPDGGPVRVDLLAAVGACMAEHEIPAGLLEVEITESVVMADAEHSVELLQQLRSIGVNLSVDDFGTGYSSLSYLRRFPLEAVKIDGSFIHDVTTSPEEGSIAVAIIEMSHRLKLKVIAECVETAEQVQFLQAHGCDQAQGYFFAKPLPVDQLETLWHESGGEFGELLAGSRDLQEGELLPAAWPESTAFMAALLEGSREASIAIVDGFFARGHGLVEIHRKLIHPALYRIGDLWINKQISVAQEHLATTLAISVMAHGLSRSATPPPNGKKLLLACVQGNQHAVGLQMVADAFTLAGWQVNLLGANVPFDALVDHAKQYRPDLLGLSASLPEHVGVIRELIHRLKLAMGDECPHVLGGGQGFKRFNMASEQLDDVTWISDPAEAVLAGEQLCMVETRG